MKPNPFWLGGMALMLIGVADNHPKRSRALVFTGFMLLFLSAVLTLTAHIPW